MKFGPRILIVCLLVAGLGERAQGAVSVRLLGMEGRTVSEPLAPAVFGDREQAFHIEIAGVDAKTASLHAAVFQVTPSIAMPLTADIELKNGLSLAADVPQDVRVSIKFPRVSGLAKIRYRMSIVSNGAVTNAIPAGELEFDVFPTEITRKFTDLLRPAGDLLPRLMVFGPGQKIRSFLRSLHVPFREGGDAVPEVFAPGCCYFGELPDNDQLLQARDRGGRARLAIFSPEDSLPPGVYSAQAAFGILIHVTSPLLDNVADDPRAQLALIKIVQLLSSPVPSNPIPDI